MLNPGIVIVTSNSLVPNFGELVLGCIEAFCLQLNTHAAGFMRSTSCSFQPNEQKLTIYQLDFCTAAPTAPTTSSSMIKNGCSTFFKNDNGSEVEVKYQEATAIGSSIEKEFA